MHGPQVQPQTRKTGNDSRIDQRARNLQYIVNNARFLILPWVRVKGLPSSILSRLLYLLRQGMNIVRYEDSVTDPSAISSIICRDVAPFNDRIKPRSLDFYPNVEEVIAAVQSWGRAYRYFYPE